MPRLSAPPSPASLAWLRLSISVQPGAGNPNSEAEVAAWQRVIQNLSALFASAVCCSLLSVVCFVFCAVFGCLIMYEWIMTRIWQSTKCTEKKEGRHIKDMQPKNVFMQVNAQARNKKRSSKNRTWAPTKNVKQQICLPCPDCDLPRGQVKNAWRAQFTVETGAVLGRGRGRGMAACTL